VELQPAGGGVREVSRVSGVIINGRGTRTDRDRTADIVNLPDQTVLGLTGDVDPFTQTGYVLRNQSSNATCFLLPALFLTGFFFRREASPIAIQQRTEIQNPIHDRR
jgi:hypothetical protein